MREGGGYIERGLGRGEDGYYTLPLV